MNKESVANFDIREVGKIKSVRKFIITATGLTSCINGQIVEFQQGNLGLVMGFKGDEAQILALGLNISFRTGDEVYNRGQSLSLPVGEAFLGRVVNSLCEPVDDLGKIESQEHYPVFSEAAEVMDRVPVDKTFETGTLVMDTVIPIAKGQRQLLIGDRITGKTTVAVDMILNQKGKGVICIYCCIGKPYSSLLKILDLFREKETMPYSIVVSGVSSTSVGEQYLAPYTAAMLGEYFMKRGKDVLVIFDDLTKHAWIYRQISLLLERAPGREAYPGDIFYVHSQLVERAGYLKPELKGGSMTFFPIIETLQGDLTGYIPTNMISMTDGQIYFNTSLFKRGIKPAIDFGLSVSRIGNKAQWPVMREFSKDFRLDYIQYQELLQMTRLRTSGLSKEAQARLKRGEVLTQLIVQDKNKPVSIEEQIIYLYALNLNMLDDLSTQEIEVFKEDFSKFLQKEYPGLFSEMRSFKNLSDENKKKVEGALKKFFKK
ncbi:F0F1 ATP synthase subunit alpha [Candidatus Omnitrophota bacterium]